MKITATLLLFLALLQTTNQLQAQDKKLSKEEKQKIKEEEKVLKEELKNFGKDLQAYKRHKQSMQDKLEANAALIKKQQDDLALAATAQVEAENKVADLDTKLKACESKPIPVCPEDYSKTPMGTVYKIQFGLYEKLDMTPLFNEPRYIGYEKVNNLNRYVISYFATEQQAEEFVKDVRKMGIRDAFVAKYVDGNRIFEWDKGKKK